MNPKPEDLRPVRVRFAPSPTGLIHVGNVRTALFNWLVARHYNGSFILRIEDTDEERSRPEYEQSLIQDLLWLGLEWDEGVERGGKFGPYRQSDRYQIYQSSAQKLLDEDKAFRCFCSEDEIEQIRQQQVARGETPHYSGKCRHLSPKDIQARIDSGAPFTLRLRVRQGKVGFADLVFGRIEIDTIHVSDPVLLRSDASPTYNFSCVVDDVLMRISHVIRGDGHLSNTHRQILIYEALQVPVPDFAHLSTVLGPDGQKLSKRHGATSIEEFRNQGYLPQALANYLALLGWSPPEEGKEIMSLAEIVRDFDLSRVSRSPAIFDPAKMDWMNRSYINMSDGNSLAEKANVYFVKAGLISEPAGPEVRSWLARLIDLVKTRVDHLDQLPREAGIVFGLSSPPRLDAEATEILHNPEGLAVAKEFARLVEQRDSLTLDSYREILSQVKAKTGKKGRNLFHPVRAVLTGIGFGPELERLIPLYEEGSRLSLPRPVMSCRDRICAILRAVNK